MGVDIVACEVANAFWQFKCTHGRVRHDFEINRSRRGLSIWMIWIAHEYCGLIAIEFSHLKWSAAHRRGGISFRGQRSAIWYNALVRQFQRGCVRMRGSHGDCVNVSAVE